jgi:IS605 OrfB family transposase
MSEICRTTRMKLDLPLAVAEPLIQAWTDACNFTSRLAFENGCLSNAARLQALAYQEVRAQFGLPSQIAVSAIRQVASQYAGARTAKRQLQGPLRFNRCAVVLQGGPRGRDVAFRHDGISVSTLEGRLKGVRFHGEPKLTAYLADWTFGDGRLVVRDGKVFLSVSFKREVEVNGAPVDAVVGVDRGIHVVAAVTHGRGEKLFGGGVIRHRQQQYTATRRALQRKLSERKKARTGTRSVRRTLKRQSGREQRFQRNENHRISRRIVEYAADTGPSALALEDLGGIREGRRLRKAQRSALHRWGFYQLEQLLTYKAEGRGLEIIKVDARGTSQGCSRCGHTEKANRHRHLFRCRACGHTLHADVNAAHNVRVRGIVARQVCAAMGLRQ